MHGCRFKSGYRAYNCVIKQHPGINTKSVKWVFPRFWKWRAEMFRDSHAAEHFTKQFSDSVHCANPGNMSLITKSVSFSFILTATFWSLKKPQILHLYRGILATRKNTSSEPLRNVHGDVSFPLWGFPQWLTTRYRELPWGHHKQSEVQPAPKALTWANNRSAALIVWLLLTK